MYLFGFLFACFMRSNCGLSSLGFVFGEKVTAAASISLIEISVLAAEDTALLNPVFSKGFQIGVLGLWLGKM